MPALLALVLAAVVPQAGAQERVIRCGVPLTISSVDLALDWLARHQAPDGSWGGANFTRQCVGVGCVGQGDSDHDAGVTGLALLAFLRAGHTPDSRAKAGDILSKGLAWLVANQDADGCVGPRVSKFMHNHAIAAQALAEACAVSDAPNLRGSAQRAAEFLVAAQNPGHGWGYTIRPGGSDASVTAWSIMALDAARKSGLKVQPEAFDGALLWMDEITDSAIGRSGFNSRELRRETTTAMAVSSRLTITEDRKDPKLGAVRHLLSDLPEPTPHRIDYTYWYFGSLAAYRFDGPSGEVWRTWNQPLRTALNPTQDQDGCDHGSWPSDGDRQGFDGGRVYATAINALTLEVYYRYASAFRDSKK